jgi:Ca2+-binding EF-hand superfamily protein
MYIKILLFFHIKGFIWNNAKKTKNVDSKILEFQRFFSFYATQGQLELSSIIKIFKKCNGLLDKQITLSVIDLQFSKIKSKNEKRLNYPRFLEFLTNLGSYI